MTGDSLDLKTTGTSFINSSCVYGEAQAAVARSDRERM